MRFETEVQVVRTILPTMIRKIVDVNRYYLYEERPIHILLTAWCLHIEQGIVSDIHIVGRFYDKGIAHEHLTDQVTRPTLPSPRYLLPVLSTQSDTILLLEQVLLFS